MGIWKIRWIGLTALACPLNGQGKAGDGHKKVEAAIAAGQESNEGVDCAAKGRRRRIATPSRGFSGGLAAGVAADHAAALFPAALAFDLVGGGAVLGLADAAAMAAEELSILQHRGPGEGLDPPGDLGLRQPEDFHIPAGRIAERAAMAAEVTATTAPWASASVLERTKVVRPEPSSQRCASPQVREAAAAAPSGLDGADFKQ